MIRIGYAMCGSFCTLSKAIAVIENLKNLGYDITPIMSEHTYETDTRFGRSEDFASSVETYCGKPVLHTIEEVEPIGPKSLLDILIISPCTGNTLGKIASGITDTAVTMACKAHLRNNKPVLIAISTNDGLSANAANIGLLLARKNIYFVPFYQDDPYQKSSSLMAQFEKIPEAIDAALSGQQIQPLLYTNIK